MFEGAGGGAFVVEAGEGGLPAGCAGGGVVLPRRSHGWNDPYSSTKWNVRQKAYVEALNSTVTLRLKSWFRAGHIVRRMKKTLYSTIANAPRFPAPQFKANFQRPTSDLGSNPNRSIEVQGRQNVDNVMVALYESGLVNECLSGENKGKVLYNDFVVRKLESFAHRRHRRRRHSRSRSLSLWDGFNSSKCSIVVFVQNISQQIFGSQYFQLPDDL
ncbi:Dynein light chain type 1 family protein [Hibiscus syriacus]|uniref:Dynein light chain type 1 family protein n=1 Tax=Hibiscus syriacus TaxID=106335 RepID=A0A6A2XZF0_HIBSY|nr:Dynein light chain type 1 family protein [Hibiscus syriacus]